MVDKMSSYLRRKGSDPLTVSTSVVIVWPLSLQENLSFFLEACQKLGLKGSQLFSPEDLQPGTQSPLYKSRRWELQSVFWVSLFVQVVETFICKRPVTLCIILLGLILICCVRDCTSLLPPLSWGKGSLNFGSSMNLWFTLIAMVYLLNIMYTSLHTA